MKRGRIEANWNPDLALVAEDQFERGRPVRGVIYGGHQSSGTDMDRQESGQISLGRDMSG